MAHIDDIARILLQLRAASDRITTARQILMERGGYWADDPPPSGIFEIQLLGLMGIGSSAETAVEDWITQAEAAIAQSVA